MAFYGKGIKITTGFDLGAKAPLDHRSVVATIAERDALVTGNLAYAGMIVFVEEDKKTYQYDGAAWAAFADAADVSDSAVELGELKNKVGDAAVEQHYEKCEASVEGALEVVADDAEPAEGQVKLADVAGVANVGEHVKLVGAQDATGLFKYIDDADAKLKAYVDAADAAIKYDVSYIKGEVGVRYAEAGSYVKCKATDEGAKQVITSNSEWAANTNSSRHDAEYIAQYKATHVMMPDAEKRAQIGVVNYDYVKIIDTTRYATGLYKYVDRADKVLQKNIDALDAKVGDKAVAATYEKCNADDDGALLVVADEAADFDPITQVKAADVVDIAVAGEYVKLIPAVDATGVFKYVDDAVAGLVDSAPEAMDTLKELADAIQAHQDVYEGYVVTVDNKIKEAKDAADAAQADVDALEAVVGTKRVEANEEQGIQAAEPTGIFKEMETFALKADEDAREIFGNNTAIVQEIGGIQKGQVLGDLTVKEVLNKLLFPYVAPSGTLSVREYGYFEHGNGVNVTNMTVTVEKGSEPITKIEIKKKDGTIVHTIEGADIKEDNKATYSIPTNITVPDSSNELFTAYITDSTDNVVTTPSDMKNNILFVHPTYVGVCAEDAVINEDLVKGLNKLLIGTGGGNINRSFTTNNQRIVAAVCSRPFSSMIDKNGFNISSSFKMQRMLITGLDGKAVNYFVFVNDASTVSNFNITFNF